MSFSDVSAVTNFFATANEGFNTTTSNSVSSGGNSVPLTSVSGLTNGSVFVGVIEPGGTKEQVFTGTVDVPGSQITGVKWTKGTNVDHANGVSVVDYDTGTAFNMMRAGMMQQHKQGGAHGAITADSLSTTGAVSVGGALSVTGAVSLPSGSVSSGALTNPYKFSAYNSVTTTIAASFSFTKVAFQTENFDTGSNFDSTTNYRFTAPVAGFYYFSATVVIFVANSIICQAALYKNGSAIRLSPQNINASGGNNYVGSQVECLLQLAANDYIEIYARTNQGSTSNTNIGSDVTFFDGFLVSVT